MNALDGGDGARFLAGLPARYSHVVRDQARLRAHAPALRLDSRLVSYGELWAMTQATVSALRREGVGPGDRILIVGENGVQLIVLLLAVSELDAWGVPVNARMSSHEVTAIARAADPHLALYCVEESVDAAALATGCEILSVPDLGTLACGRPIRRPSTEPVHAGAAEQVAVLVYTSGTTGQPKGVMISHLALTYMGANMAALRSFGPGDTLYNVSPISHTIGIGTVLMTAFSCGACVEIVARFTPQHLADALAAGRVTALTGTPTLLQRLLDHCDALARPLSAPAIRVIGVAGAPLDPSLKARAERAFGVGIANSYGMTEINPIARSAAGVAEDEVGEAQPGTRIRIVRDGVDAPVGETGEVWASGPGRMLGYFRDPEATAAVEQPGGWIATGDLGRMEPDGRFRIVGRIKEVILRGGFTVHPAEVEAALGLCPGVVAVAVVGRPVPGDEEIVAFVQPAPGAALETTTLAAWARERLSPYKRPSEIRLLKTLPVGPTGKVMKIRLKESLRATSSQTKDTPP